jgi:hypothetical protein
MTGWSVVALGYAIGALVWLVLVLRARTRHR